MQELASGWQISCVAGRRGGERLWQAVFGGPPVTAAPRAQQRRQVLHKRCTLNKNSSHKCCACTIIAPANACTS